MQTQTKSDDAKFNQGNGSAWEVEDLCKRFGLSYDTAQNLLKSFSSDQMRLEYEARRLGIYERLH